MKIPPEGLAREPEVMVEINTTPLIDVMLVLLIMLIIAIPVQTHAVKLDMPGAAAPPQTAPAVVSVEVDFDGTYVWNGEVLTGRSELEARLRSAAGMAVQPEIHLRANRLVRYESVAAVMASAQRLGLTRVGLIGNEQFSR
jgi:biopolymer transport protein ExbD